MTNSSNTMWGGRFKSSPSQAMEEINESITFDKILYKQDIMGSVAHAKMLEKNKIIDEKDSKKIIEGLKKIEKEISDNNFTFKTSLEDIHMNIESRLKEIIGDIAGKLHTARSRNDQIATDFKIFVRQEGQKNIQLLIELCKSLISQSSKNIDAIMPGYTHLQTAQPVLFAHHLMAYFQMFKRDISRLIDLNKRMNECPLGSCALGGTSFKIDRHFTAKELGFEKPTENSMDSVSDRDFALEYLFCLSTISVHLSRLGEEIVIWMSKGFDFINLSDAFTSGSSIMPQKKNPDAAELIRGKSGRIFGSLFTLLSVLKGLPLTYSKDMQEDKEPVFDAAKNIELCLLATIGMIDDMSVNKDKMQIAAKQGFSTATDLADWLVKNLKIPFRQAHNITGKLVKIAEENNCDLSDLSLEKMQEVESKINKNIFDVLSIENSINSKTSYGSSSKISVKTQIINGKKFLNDI